MQEPLLSQHVHDCGCPVEHSDAQSSEESELNAQDTALSREELEKAHEERLHNLDERLNKKRNRLEQAERDIKLNDQSQDEHSQIVHQLASGHRVEISTGGQSISVFDSKEQLQVSIVLTDDNPVVRLQGGNIQMHSASDIDLSCEHFNVNAKKDMHLNSNGELLIESAEDLHINSEMDIHIRGKMIWLN